MIPYVTLQDIKDYMANSYRQYHFGCEVLRKIGVCPSTELAELITKEYIAELEHGDYLMFYCCMEDVYDNLKKAGLGFKKYMMSRYGDSRNVYDQESVNITREELEGLKEVQNDSEA